MDYEKLNPGIRKTVKLLRDNGFDTRDSGDGKTHEFECDQPFAYVNILTEPSKMVQEADRLKALLETHGVEIEQVNPEELPSIQADYDPANRLACMTLFYVDDSMIKEPVVMGLA